MSPLRDGPDSSPKEGLRPQSHLEEYLYKAMHGVNPNSAIVSCLHSLPERKELSSDVTARVPEVFSPFIFLIDFS